MAAAADAEYPVQPLAVFFAVAAASVVLLDIPPFIWHFRNRNLAACSLVLWLLLQNSFIFGNALIWPRDNLLDWYLGVGVCDVEVYLLVGSWVGVTASLVCIMRSLAQVMDAKNVVVAPSQAQRRRQCIVDVLICIGLPALQMSLYYTIQPIRYFIHGFNGCAPSIVPSWPGIVLAYMWPPILGLVVVYYAVLVIIRLHRYRAEFSRMLQASNTTRSRFLRLFLMSALLVLGILPTQASILYINISQGQTPYSWSDVHGPRWNQVIKVPSEGRSKLDRWVWLVCGFFVFLFFGLGTDAAAMYRTWFAKLGLTKLFNACCGSRRSGSPGEHVAPCPTRSSFSTKARSMFSYKSHLTPSTTSCATNASFFKRRLSSFFWSNSISTDDSARLPTHNHNCTGNRTNSTLAPSIDTAISTTPFCNAFSHRKTSITNTDDSTLLGSPVSDKRFSMLGGDDEMGAVLPPTTVAKEQKERELEMHVLDRLCMGKDKQDRKIWRGEE